MGLTNFEACSRDRFIHVGDGRIELFPTLLPDERDGCARYSGRDVYAAGHSWLRQHPGLGPEAHAQGEYLVRLRLRGYAPSGQVSHR